MSRASRRSYVEQRIRLAEAAILEFGALDAPTYPDRNCEYIDWFTRNELKSSLAENPRRLPERFVEPTYVIKEKRFAQEVRKTFDLLIANHVIEHVADPITWLQQARQLAPMGYLFLAVPDRRFTFDYLRPESTMGDLLRAYEEDLVRPSRWQMFDSVFYYRPLRAEQVWAGDLSGLMRPRYTVQEAFEMSERAEQEYVDVHCHTFTAASFQWLMDELTPLTGWGVDHVSEVARGANEFYAWLR